MKLNLVMIVKNEERSLRRCLKAAKALVDQVIIADTGSSDRTAEIAKSMGAVVVEFPWVNDFSAARNFALDHSDADWNLVLDADEYLRPCSRRTLERILTSRGGTWLGGLTRYDSFEELDELAYSALEEIGNIIICSYVNAFTQLVGVEIDLSVPSSTLNMLGGILTVPIAEYGYETDKLMYINAEFIIDGRKLSDGLLMLPDIASLNGILERLGVI